MVIYLICVDDKPCVAYMTHYSKPTSKKSESHIHTKEKYFLLFGDDRKIKCQTKAISQITDKEKMHFPSWPSVRAVWFTITDWILLFKSQPEKERKTSFILDKRAIHFMHITDLAVCSAQSNPKYPAKSKKQEARRINCCWKIWLLYAFHGSRASFFIKKTGVASVWAVKWVSYNLSDIISCSVKYEMYEKRAISDIHKSNKYA